VISDPVISDPVISDPVISDPVISDPVISDPVISDPVIRTPMAHLLLWRCFPWLLSLSTPPRSDSVGVIRPEMKEDARSKNPGVDFMKPFRPNFTDKT
jgi:hypothetical protein